MCKHPSWLNTIQPGDLLIINWIRDEYLNKQNIIDYCHFVSLHLDDNVIFVSHVHDGCEHPLGLNSYGYLWTAKVVKKAD